MDGGSRVADARLVLLGSLNTLQNCLCRILAISSGDEHIELFSSNSIGMDCFCLENFLAKEIFVIFTDSIDSLIFFKC